MAGYFIHTAATALAGIALTLTGCGAGQTPPPQSLTDSERGAIDDTLRQLARESSDVFDAELDCAAIVDRLTSGGGPAGGAWPGYFVAQGRIIEPGGRDEMVQMCRMIKRDRLSAHQEIQEQRVEVLGRDAGVVITRGVYTVQYRDGRIMVRPQVVTTVWSRAPDGWRRVHLHESPGPHRVRASAGDVSGLLPDVVSVRGAARPAAR